MTTTLSPPRHAATLPTSKQPTPALNHFLMREASWSFYMKLVEEVRKQNIRVTYADGRMEIMSPLPEHEQAKRILGMLVERLALAMDIPFVPFGSTTYAYTHLQKGLEPDDCFYFGEHEAQMRGKKRLELPADPPPDLVLEIDISYRAIDRQSIYAAMKVPEIWLFDEAKIQCLLLDAQGQYQPADYSATFTSVRVADLMQWVRMAYEKGLRDMVKGFDHWVTKLPAKPNQT